MSDSSGSAMGLAVVGLWVGAGVCEIYGLYLAAQEGVGPFLVALFIPPWAIVKGFMGFF